MKKRWIIGATAVAILSVAVLAGCGNSSKGASSSGDNNKNIKASITLADDKTDWASNGTWKKYIAEFNKEYPNIKVKEEALNNYDQTEQTRMSSKNFGDVVMLPAAVAPKDYPAFFTSLGKTSALSKKYQGTSDRTYGGQQYGLPSEMNATGMLANMNVFKAAGIDSWPTTTADLIKDLQTIKAKEPGVIPLYTNYACGWALVDWDFTRNAVSGNPNMDYQELANNTSPFSKGKTMYTIYDTLYQTAKDGLIDPDPTTDDWNTSVTDMAKNKVAVMVLGSWAVPQVQSQMKSGQANIKMEAFPQAAPNGKTYMLLGGDYNWAINKNSKSQQADRDLVDWLVNKSNFAKDNGGMSPVKGSKAPADFDLENGVKFIQSGTTPKAKADWFSNVNNTSQVGIGTTQTVKQQIIDAGDGSSKKSFSSIMSGLNASWGKAVKQYGYNK